MANDYKFNLLKYVYGRLYAGTFEFNSVKEKRSKIYTWFGVLKWLQEENYISDYKVKPIDKEYSVITYTFNKNKLMYEYYLKGIERSISQYIIPTGERFENTKPDKVNEWEEEYRNQFKALVEYV